MGVVDPFDIQAKFQPDPNDDFPQGCVDISGHVILNDHRERRISLESLQAIASWRFFVATLLRMTCLSECQQNQDIVARFGRRDND
jgi:hypothetical protein